MFANPLGLLGLLSLAAILGLHLYRRRRTPLLVSAVFLWEDVSSEAQGGRQRQPLRKSLSLLAELLAALCLTLALSGPRVPGQEASAHYVVVLDSSASLTARALDGSTARDRARGAIAASIKQLESDSRVTLVATGPEPVVLAGPFAFKGEALEKLNGPWPIHGDHSPAGALLLASELSALGPIDFVTDARPREGEAEDETLGERLRWIAVGEPASNVGFTAALRTGQTADRDEITLAIRHTGPKERRVRLEVVPVEAAPGDSSPEGTDYALAPGETRTVKLSFSPAGADAVARLVPVDGDAPLDAFPIDDEAYLCAAPRRTLRLASTLNATAARSLGLGSAGSAERWAEIVPEASAVTLEGAPHLVIGTVSPTGALPAAGDAAPWTLFLQSDVREPAHLTGPFLLDPTHPLLRGVSLDGVVWSMDEPAASSLPPDTTVLAYAGDTPLITESILKDATRHWRLLVDPAYTNLGRSADWPILLANAAEDRRRALPGPVATSLSVGERFRWRGPPQRALELVAPSGAVLALPSSSQVELATPRLDEIGLWRLRAANGGATLQTIGVSLVSSSESDLSGRSSLAQPPVDLSTLQRTASGGARVTWLETALMLAAGALLALNWWVLRDRRLA